MSELLAQSVLTSIGVELTIDEIKDLYNHIYLRQNADFESHLGPPVSADTSTGDPEVHSPAAPDTRRGPTS